MLPVADNLLQVGGRVKQEMLPPFVPVHGHSAIDIDTAQGQTEGIDILTTLTSFSPKKTGDIYWKHASKHHKLGPSNKSNLSNNRNYEFMELLVLHVSSNPPPKEMDACVM